MTTLGVATPFRVHKQTVARKKGRRLERCFSRKGIQIYRGDCLGIMPQLSRRKFDLVLSDPPYSIKNVGGGGFKAKIYDDPKFKVLCNFEPEPFLERVAECQTRANIVCTCSRDLIRRYAVFANARGWGFDVHVWHKPNAVPFTNGTFKSDLEYVVLLYQGPRPFNKGFPQATYSKLFTHGTIRKKVHPTQKPIDLMLKYARILCPPGGRILDPFMGGGTTLVAAQQLGLRAVGIEHDQDYCNAAIERLRKEK
jgi:DNA modification methylase